MGVCKFRAGMVMQCVNILPEKANIPSVGQFSSCCTPAKLPVDMPWKVAADGLNIQAAATMWETNVVFQAPGNALWPSRK